MQKAIALFGGLVSLGFAMVIGEGVSADSPSSIKPLRHDHPTEKNRQVNDAELRISEMLRKEIGAPDGWLVTIRRFQSRKEKGVPCRSLILQMQLKDGTFRLVLARSYAQNGFTVEIESECSLGFPIYCERSYSRIPTAAASTLLLAHTHLYQT